MVIFKYSHQDEDEDEDEDEKKLGMQNTGNKNKQANLPELLRSIPPRVRFTSLPFWGMALWKI